MAFVNYVVSVATHPIGSRASTSPYNSNQDDLLAYIVDMFNLDHTNSDKIIHAKPSPNQSPIHKLSIDDLKSLDSRRTHSWRPELRIKINPPNFFIKETIYLSNLYVRVFLFQEKKNAMKPDNEIYKRVSKGDGKGILNRFFKRINSNSVIRPASEMVNLIKFEYSKPNRLERTSRPSPSRSNFKMIQVKDGARVDEDIHLHIRRYYCEPKSDHILRFEFWLNSDIVEDNSIQRIRASLRQILFKARCFGYRNQDPTRYQNMRQDFYGFINIKLSQLQSYATKQSYPILNMRERKINTCEIALEPRNRRLIEDNASTTGRLPIGELPRKSSDEFIINHIRMFFNCLVYQSKDLMRKIDAGHISSDQYQDVTLDNLLYIPAHSLINQHRLQSNLNRLEDMSLKRTTILLSMIKFTSQTHGQDIRILTRTRMIYISILQNEFSIAAQSVDDKTLQELDPFLDDFNHDPTRNTIRELEIRVLQRFVREILIPNLKLWMASPIEGKSKAHMFRLETLMGLKMAKTALKYFDSRPDEKLPEVDLIRLQIDTVLCDTVINNFRVSIESIIQSSDYVRQNHRKDSIEETAWLRLLRKIKHINNDICLYWNSQGFDGIAMNSVDLIRGLKTFNRLENTGLRKIIQQKVDTFLN